MHFDFVLIMFHLIFIIIAFIFIDYFVNMSKTKFGEYIVYYEESTFVVEIVHTIQYVNYS